MHRRHNKQPRLKINVLGKSTEAGARHANMMQTACSLVHCNAKSSESES